MTFFTEIRNCKIIFLLKIRKFTELLHPWKDAYRLVRPLVSKWGNNQLTGCGRVLPSKIAYHVGMTSCNICIWIISHVDLHMANAASSLMRRDATSRMRQAHVWGTHPSDGRFVRKCSTSDKICPIGPKRIRRDQPHRVRFVRAKTNYWPDYFLPKIKR